MRTVTILVFTTILATAHIISAGVAQEASSPPTVSELQRLQLVTVTQRLEIAQLKAQAVQREFDDARKELVTLKADLESKAPGFVLDLQTLTFRPAPEAPAK
jgi:hypothetical protein